MSSDPDDFLAPRYWNGLIKMAMSRAYILAALARKPMHGYEIARVVSAMSEGCCAPTAGALYPALAAFEAGGYLRAHEEWQGARGRKIYTLTERGHAALKVAQASWAEAARHLQPSGSLPSIPPSDAMNATPATGESAINKAEETP